MALGATVYHLKVALSDVDRNVYEALDLRLGRHPSETLRYLVTRVLAYCLCYEDGIAFSKGGLSDPDEPTLSVRDPQGNLRIWIEIGTPAPERLHKASKAASRVVVFTHNDPAQLMRATEGKVIHKASTIMVHSFPSAFLDTLEAVTERNTQWEVAHTEGHLYLTAGGQSFDAAIMTQPLRPPG